MLKNKKDDDIIYHRLRWDYMNNNVLVSTAMLSAFWEKERKDTFDLLSPFVEYSIAKTTNVGELLQIQDLQNYLKTEFGYEEIPINAITLILNRLSPKILKRENKQYRLMESLDSKINKFEDERVRYKERAEKVASVLTDYLNARLSAKFNREKALNALIDFFAINGMYVISDITALELLKSKDNELVYCIAQFVVNEYEQDSLVFHYIVSMVKGFFVSTAISLQPQNADVTKSKFKELKCYVDTPVIISALGMTTETEAAAAKELLTMLREKGAKLYCFRHTYREIDSILEAYKYSLKYGTLSNHTLESWDEKEYTVSDVERQQSLLKSKIKSIGIDIVEAPDCTKNTDKYPLDYIDFKSYIGEKISYAKEDALDRDIKSIVSILLMRDGCSSDCIEECRFIFVTSNIGLVKRSNEYLIKSNIVRGDSVMPINTDIELSSIVWLKCYASHEDYPRNKLIEYAFAALEPTEEILNVFRDKVDKIRADGGITEEEAAIIKTDHFSRRKLAETARGNPRRVDENTVYEIKAELKDRLVGDVRRKKDAEIEEYRVREELMLKDHQRVSKDYQKKSEECMKISEEKKKFEDRTRDCIIRSIKAHGKKVEKRTRIVCEILFYTLLAAFIVVSIVADVINSGGNVCNGFVVFSLILGTLAAIDGAISKLNYVSRITNKIAYKASAKAMDKEKEKNKQKFNDVISFDDFIAK